MLFVAKNLERIGDHATNIAEIVHYEITGEHIADRPASRPKVDGSQQAPPGGGGRYDARRPCSPTISSRTVMTVTRAGDGEEALILVDEVCPT